MLYRKSGIVFGRQVCRVDLRVLLPRLPPDLDETPLLYSRTTALNQNDQHDHKEHTGNNPDKRDTTHFKSPFPQVDTSCARSTYLSWAHRPTMQPFLLHLRAAALNQNDQHDHKEHTGNNPDKRDTTHLVPLSLND
jgi:hypothetical protein